MKTKGLWMALMALMMCFVTGEAYAYDIKVENADGVTIYYNYFNEGRELQVTYYTDLYDYNRNAYKGSVVIPEEVTFMNRTRKVTSIGGYAFYYCSGLTSVTIPNSVTSIGEYAFQSCSGLTSVTIPNSVTSIGSFAFFGCTGLTSVTIPNSVTSIGGAAFTDCSGLTSVTIPNSVTSIGSNAFDRCYGLTSVTIPNSVTSIGESAFNSCSGLTSIEVENGNMVYDSRDNCNAIINSSTNELIAGCQNTIIPNSVTSIGSFAFFGCTGLTSITIPNNVTFIGNHAFYNCSGLTSLTIPNSVASIGVCAFCECSGLTSVTIGTSVTSIGESAFGDCTSLTSVTIPNSVTSIGVGAFVGCSDLTSITIPNSVTFIGNRAFDNCDLESVISLIEEPFAITWKANIDRIFSLNTFNNATLYVPAGTIDKYKATEGWKDFAHIEEGDGGGGGITPEEKVCAKPTIHYQNGQLSFKCATEGAEFKYDIKDSDVTYGSGSTVNLNVTYHISVYATREGYTNSELATATLCWIDVEPQKEGITGDEDVVTEVKAMPVLIQSEGSGLRIDGAQAGTPIGVYDLSRRLIEKTTAIGNATRVAVPAGEKMVVVKVGERAVKVVMGNEIMK